MGVIGSCPDWAKATYGVCKNRTFCRLDWARLQHPSVHMRGASSAELTRKLHLPVCASARRGDGLNLTLHLLADSRAKSKITSDVDTSDVRLNSGNWDSEEWGLW